MDGVQIWTIMYNLTIFFKDLSSSVTIVVNHPVCMHACMHACIVSRPCQHQGEIPSLFLLFNLDYLERKRRKNQVYSHAYTTSTCMPWLHYRVSETPFLLKTVLWSLSSSQSVGSQPAWEIGNGLLLRVRTYVLSNFVFCVLNTVRMRLLQLRKGICMKNRFTGLFCHFSLTFD